MTIDEYFGDWMKVLDRAETMKIMGWLKTVNPNTLCPALPNIFRAFKLCSYEDCRVVFIGKDPYPQSRTWRFWLNSAASSASSCSDLRQALPSQTSVSPFVK